MFRVILRNILDNAIKYSFYNGEISIKAREDKQYLYLSVIDNGIGFDSDVIKNGYGLGLELCYDFLKLNKGELIIDISKTGSNVSIKLPIYKDSIRKNSFIS